MYITKACLLQDTLAFPIAPVVNENSYCRYRVLPGPFSVHSFYFFLRVLDMIEFTSLR